MVWVRLGHFDKEHADKPVEVGFHFLSPFDAFCRLHKVTYALFEGDITSLVGSISSIPIPIAWFNLKLTS